MKLDATQIDDPGKPRRIVHHNFLRGPARWKGKRGGTQPSRAFSRCALLVKRLGLSPVYKSLEDDRPVANAIECAWGD